mmetsp:Transcript_10756/g.20640  ORF Transcript_10756/g.20640 Transcript_10756/m.20640 type:complete len:208 (-) Transcript_10756:256-879(-)
MFAPGRMGRGAEAGRSAPVMGAILLAGRAGAGLPFAAAGAGDFFAGCFLFKLFRLAATTEKLTAPNAASCCRLVATSAGFFAGAVPLFFIGTTVFLAGAGASFFPKVKGKEALFAVGAIGLFTVPVVRGGGGSLTVPPFLTVPRRTAFFFTVAAGATFFFVATTAFFTGATLAPIFTFVVPEVRGGGAFFVIVDVPGLQKDLVDSGE